MNWIWDPDKAAANLRNHGISFEDAQKILDDPLSRSQLDPRHYEDRYNTIGILNNNAIVVTHTLPDPNSRRQTGRIISARQATARQRNLYENKNLYD